MKQGDIGTKLPQKICCILQGESRWILINEELLTTKTTDQWITCEVHCTFYEWKISSTRM